MEINVMVLIFLAGLTTLALGGTSSDADEPIQPVLQTNMEDVELWNRAGQWQYTFHRSAKGELVLLGYLGKSELFGPALGMASTDEGRTWYEWPAVRTWPEGLVQAVTRRGKELLLEMAVGVSKETGLCIWRSQDEGKTWTGGERVLNLAQRTADDKLLWYTPGNRILVTKAGRLLMSVDFLLGDEGAGPEIVGTLVSEDNGHTWRIYELFGPPAGYRDRPEGFGEPKIVELADGRIWMVFRTPLGHLWQAFSTDGGRTWGEPSSTGLVSLLAPFNAQIDPGSKAVVVVYNPVKPTPSMTWDTEHNWWRPRAPMAFAVSHDNCKTWSRPVIITKNRGFMRNMYFSDKEMFIIYQEGPTPKRGGGSPGKLVIYDLKTVLALRPEE